VIAFTDGAADTQALDPSGIADDLGPRGGIAREMDQYEDRPTQREMARAIAELYNDGGVGLLEAGTGVGKSLGYLLPHADNSSSGVPGHQARDERYRNRAESQQLVMKTLEREGVAES